MKKTRILPGALLVLLLMLPLAAQAEDVSLDVFTDEVLHARLAEYADKNGDGSLSDGEISQVKELYLNDTDLASLEGLEYLTSLTTLNCSGTRLERVPTEKFPQLRDLSCSDLGLKTLDVSGLPELISLTCWNNDLTSLDLSGNPNLASLNFDNNRVSDLEIRGDMRLEQLVTLDCSRNPLDRIPTESFPGLEILYCSGMGLKTLDLGGLSGLKELTCSGNELEALDLSGNPDLEYLVCSGNPLSYLDVSGNRKLQSLECHKTELTSLDVSGLSELTQLNTERCFLTSLRLRGCAALERLECSQQFLTELDFSDCANLRVVQADVNRLETLDFSACPALEELYCGDNRLTRLDVTACGNLRYLHCGGNRMAQVDVSRNAKLKELWVEAMTGLTGIDLSGNPELVQFLCYWNNVSSLDFSHNPKLRDVWIDGNHLTHADLSATSVEEDNSKLFNNVYYLDGTDTLDLDTLPGFELARASKWSGCTLNGTVLTLTQNEASYTYDCGRGMNVVFTIRKAAYAQGFLYEPLDSSTARIVGCDLSGDVVVPESLGGYRITDLASKLFSYKGGITSVTLPAGLATFAGSDVYAYEVFEGCRDLRNIHVAEGSKTFSSADGVLFSADGSHMLFYPPAREETEVVFPASVTLFAFKSFCEVHIPKRIFIENPDASWEYNFTILKDAVIYYHPGGLTEEQALEMMNDDNYEPRTYHPVFIALDGGDPGENADSIADRLVGELITDGMTETRKAKVLHDWITTHTRYSLKYDSATGVLKYGEGHCQSYAKAYQLLLDKAGLENRLVTGCAGDSLAEAEGHMWNLVKIGGLWLHVDCTWDDPVNEDGSFPAEACTGRENHNYFLAPASEIRTDHFWDGSEADLTGWVPEPDGKASFRNGEGDPVTGWQVIRGESFWFDPATGISVTENTAVDGIPCEFEAVCVLTDDDGEHFAGILLVLEIPDTFDGVLTMPAGLVKIEGDAFAGTNAEAVYLSENSEILGAGAFANLRKRTYVFVPAGLRTIDPLAFENSRVVFVVDGTVPQCLIDWLAEHPGAHVIAR